MAKKNDQKRVNRNEECCPEFDPSGWDEKIIEWEDKRFIKGKVCTLFYMPLNFGYVMKKLVKKVENSGAAIQDGLALSDHTSKWNMDIYVAVDKEVPEVTNTNLSGRFLCKVYEGDFKETGKWCKDFEKYAEAKEMKIDKWYMWYTTCPKCAKKYGKNYVAILGKVS
jgi:hypothetical protein